MKTDVKIMGTYVPDGQDWRVIHYQYLDGKIQGIGCGSFVCSKSYFEKICSNERNLAVGYDKEKKRNFLYVKK